MPRRPIVGREGQKINLQLPEPMAPQIGADCAESVSRQDNRLSKPNTAKGPLDCMMHFRDKAAIFLEDTRLT